MKGTAWHLACEIAREVLGPRNGPWEVIDENPLQEYITGVLVPRAPAYRSLDPDEEPSDAAFSEELEEGGVAVDELELEGTSGTIPVFVPFLDPKSRPHSCGISFRVRLQTEGFLRFRACVTWGTYRKEKDGTSVTWMRTPKGKIVEFPQSSLSGNVELERGFSVYYDISPLGENKYDVSVFLVNERQLPGDEEFSPVEDCIFQPELRIVLGKGLTLEPVELPLEDEMGFLLRNEVVYARGHMCSAIWKEVDPQRPPVAEVPVWPLSAPFWWTDAVAVPQGERETFRLPDLRTSFVPVFAIHSPVMELEGINLEANHLAEMWAPDRLRSTLGALLDGYQKWVENLEHERREKYNNIEVAKKLLRQCRKVLSRLKKALDLLEKDSEARLAFCFAMKAMDLQARWAGRDSLRWRPFQLAFILNVLESIAQPDSEYRQTCDILWVPTGAGKTEAYLAIAIFAIALRRLRERKLGHPGAGVAVISRYTLRLLTVQQFRRTLRVITACEFLRVSGLGSGGPVGWRPAGCNINTDFLWGTARFSVGLWVGGELTPNRLGRLWIGEKQEPGAIEILRGQQGMGDPAQVTHCPACGALLAIPRQGLPRGSHRLFITVQCQRSLDHTGKEGFHPLDRPGYGTVEVNLVVTEQRDEENIRDEIMCKLRERFPCCEPVCASVTRPGYFILHYRRPRAGDSEPFDFEIFCPFPECPLRHPWVEGLPAGRASGSDFPQSPTVHGSAFSVNLPCEMLPVGTVEAFADPMNPFIGRRIPIPACTVDEQIYGRLPSMLISTADKFARLSFEPKSASIFGNVSVHHVLYGFLRDGDDPPRLTGAQYRRECRRTVAAPELILQDELHLISGPLGSMVALYETAVDALCGERNVKLIASSATVREAAHQIKLLFARDLFVFPPPGLSISDRFFLRFESAHPLDESRPGRLHVGVCAPGLGPLTPMVRIWSRILVACREAVGGGVDQFRTAVGYFNAIRELAMVRSLVRQDIPMRIRDIHGNPGSIIRDDELSSRIDPGMVPVILDRLEKRRNPPDVLLTTSMFGTGVDVPWLSVMVVAGQPKSTSEYIQAAGRIGRERMGIVVTFYRATRPRDLNHYEMFIGYHARIESFVEIASLSPFAPGVLDRACGPVQVAIVRCLNQSGWKREEAKLPVTGDSFPALKESMAEILTRRAEKTESGMESDVREHAFSCMERWRNEVMRGGDWFYEWYGIGNPPRGVVLGNLELERRGLRIVFRNAPQSLRSIEDVCDLLY